VENQTMSGAAKPAGRWLRGSLVVTLVSAALLGLLGVGSIAGAEESQSLASEARDPTGNIMAFNVRYDLTASFHDLDDETSGTVLIQPVIPFKLAGFSNIARISVPIVTHTPSTKIRADDIAPGLPSATIGANSEGGLSDSVLLNVVTFPVPMGRLGLGPVLGVPTATSKSLGSGRWTAGPAGAAILRHGQYMFGGLFQGYFTFAGRNSGKDVNSLAIQPFFSRSLPNGWAVGVSEMNFAYDFEGGKWTNLPIGLSVEKLIHFGSQPVRTFVQLEYNLKDDPLSPEWVVRFNFAPLFVLGGD
jgi:hypothetical protein